MKCDELKVYVPQDGPWGLEPEEGGKLEAAKHPDYNLEQLLNIVPTHYSNMASARQSIVRYAKQGIIEKFWK